MFMVLSGLSSPDGSFDRAAMSITVSISSSIFPSNCRMSSLMISRFLLPDISFRDSSPKKNLSRHLTLCPLSSMSRVRTEPMYPAPPVISTFMLTLLCLGLLGVLYVYKLINLPA